MSVVAGNFKRKGKQKRVGGKTIMTIAREAVRDTSMLPHEWLWKLALGEEIEQRIWNAEHHHFESHMIHATLEMRIEAAKAAAPYYAPKLATQFVELKSQSGVLDASALRDMPRGEIETMALLLRKAAFSEEVGALREADG